MYILVALLSSLAYSIDTIIGKISLSKMSFIVFMFILSISYTIFGIILFAWNKNEYIVYFKKPENVKPIMYGLLGAGFGTILAHILMYKAIDLSQKGQLPITMSIIHSAPIFTVLFVIIFFHKYMNFKSFMGLITIIIGYIIMFHYADKK